MLCHVVESQSSRHPSPDTAAVVGGPIRIGHIRSINSKTFKLIIINSKNGNNQMIIQRVTTLMTRNNNQCVPNDAAMYELTKQIKITTEFEFDMQTLLSDH